MDTRVLDITVFDGKIVGILIKPGSEPDKRFEKFEPGKQETKVIELLIKQLKFLVNRGVLSKQVQKEALTILTDLVKLLGEYLYHTLFKGKIEVLLNDALKDEHLELLRVELEFQGKSEVFAEWPWEYLYQPGEGIDGRFLAKEAQLVLNRRLTLENVPPVPDMKTTRPKVLLVISAPKGYPVVCNDVIDTLTKLAQENRIELKMLAESPESPFNKTPLPATLTNLYKATKSKSIDDPGYSPDIIHFVGHGQCTTDGAQVALVDVKGDVDWKSDSDFAEWASKGNKKPKLIFLQACESALPDTYRGVSGVARKLAFCNIPAVVAMQYKVGMATAGTFACGFYEALADGEPIDLAVKAGRQAINESPEYKQFHAFGLPVLYLRSHESIMAKRIVSSTGDSLVPPVPSPSPANVAPSSQKKVKVKCPKDKIWVTEDICPKCNVNFLCPHCKGKVRYPLEYEGIVCDLCHEPFVSAGTDTIVKADIGQKVQSGVIIDIARAPVQTMTRPASASSEERKPQDGPTVDPNVAALPIWPNFGVPTGPRNN